jgi:hypothetical protein
MFKKDFELTMTTDEERRQRKIARRGASEPLTLMVLVKRLIGPFILSFVGIWSARYFRFSSTHILGPYIKDSFFVLALWCGFGIILLVIWLRGSVR